MKPQPVPVKLLKLWFSVVHGALCRQVAGGLLVQLPPHPKLLVCEGSEHIRELVVLFGGCDQIQLEQEARRVFSEDPLLCVVVNDISQKPPSDTGPHVSLRRVFSDLQGYLLDTSDPVPEEAQLIAFFLRHGKYRSRHIALRRTVYHVVPHEGGWRVQCQGEDDGDTYALKDEAINAGSARAQAHAAGQLIIHAADGTFEEERTYGGDPRESSG